MILHFDVPGTKVSIKMQSSEFSLSDADVAAIRADASRSMELHVSMMNSARILDNYALQSIFGAH